MSTLMSIAEAADSLFQALDRRAPLVDVEAEYARYVLALNNGNKKATCRQMGIAYNTLQVYLRRGGAI